MSIETKLKMKVGDGIDAQKAQLSLAFVFANIAGGETITFTDPQGNEFVLTEGVDFTGLDEPSLILALKAAIEAISGLTVTNSANPLIVQVEQEGVEGNEWTVASSDNNAFQEAPFLNGRDADDPVIFEMLSDSDGIATATVDGNIVFRVPLSTLFDTNTATFQVNLQNFLRKLQC